MSTNTTNLAMPPIVDRDTWTASLTEQEKLEVELAEHLKIVTAARRRMPMTPVQGEYTFVGPEGEVSFAELFQGQRQLVAYHFMYAPDWSKGCPHCTQHARNQGEGINDEVNKQETRYILTSRAPYEKLAAWAEEKKIATPWYSAPSEFSEEMGALAEGFGDIPGFTVFFRDDDDNVYRTWKGSAFGIEATIPTRGILQATPYGMREKGEDSPEGWPQPNEPVG